MRGVSLIASESFFIYKELFNAVRGGGVVYFFTQKNRRKMRKGSALDPNEDIVSMGVYSPFIRPLM